MVQEVKTNSYSLPFKLIMKVKRVYIECHWSTGGKEDNSVGGKLLKTPQRNLLLRDILKNQELSRKGKVDQVEKTTGEY